MSLKDEMQEDMNQYSSSRNSSNFKFEKSGVYKMRVLAKPVALATHFFGKGNPAVVCVGKDKGCIWHGDKAPLDQEGKPSEPSVKFVTYIVDRTDGVVKMAELPWSIVKAIGEYKEDDDYEFDDFPMPYDIKVTYDKENKVFKDIYKVMPSPKSTPLTDEEKQAYEEVEKTPDQYVEMKKQKELRKLAGVGEPIEYPEEEIDPESIPF